MRMAQTAASTFALKTGAGLELEIDKGVEIAPRKKCQHDKCDGSEAGSNGVGRSCKWILVIAGFQQKVREEQRYREKAKHQERRSVFTPPGEIRQSCQQLHC